MSWFTGGRNEKPSAQSAGEALARQAAAALAGLLAERGVTRSELAARMGVSPGRVSQILSGDANLTVRSLAAAATALDACVEVRFFDPPRPETDGIEERTGVADSSPLSSGFLPTRR